MALLQRTNVLDEEECITIVNEIPAIITTTENLREMMDKAIKKQLNVPVAYENKGNVNLTTWLRREITIFNDEGICGHYLTIAPTSVEAETAFPAAELIFTKIRSRLSDKTNDILCQLRAYFQKGLKKNIYAEIIG